MGGRHAATSHHTQCRHKGFVQNRGTCRRRGQDKFLLTHTKWWGKRQGVLSRKVRNAGQRVALLYPSHTCLCSFLRCPISSYPSHLGGAVLLFSRCNIRHYDSPV